MRSAGDNHLHEQLADYLRDLIAEGHLQPGDTLPSEAELCRKFSSSRSPVRQAITTLRREGLISGGQGRRSIVQSPAATQSFGTLISFTEWCRSLEVTPGQRTLLLSRTSATAASESPDPFVASASAELGLSPEDNFVHLLRLRFMNDRPAMLERAAFPLHVGRLLFDFDTDSGSIYEYLTSQGVELYRAENRIDALAASESDATQLDVDTHSPLLRVRRRTTDTRGRVLEVADDRYLPKHTSFTIVNTRDASPTTP
ncbi:GntR family transcriptional regulator [Corynebacterium falsenii DSM 44353]|uniref:GntR family transcriptional regulator n=1 Tax=Corynebacterium falsenii TaxID=108486 RepID=UPI0003E96D3E|nr:GntR family transcriptional regulator [Corynebacterium falsenii]AHI03721.1 GntR family transcriptional regulator [Corynebacterium falsenii DSM 44353]UBI04450.1 GntR family transcriptional regulator [Corynebacterium falsenii]UBI07517.1 GntR family transcriptional regulator [Corynebacterium falsenii]